MPKPVQKKPVKKVEDGPVERPVIYPDYTVEICCGEAALTVAKAKELLGWETERLPSDSDPGVKFTQGVVLADNEGRKVRFNNNTRNRPFHLDRALRYKQEILHRQFAPEGPNGETVVIGRTGQVNSAQHRLAGLALAGEDWADPKQVAAKQHWDTEPTMETVIFYGASEGSKTLATYDNVLPRTLSDTIYTSDHFASVPDDDRATISRATERAVQLLWDRLGVEDAFNKYLTQSLAADFIDRHPRLLECVKHLSEENKNGAVAKYLTVGYAATVLYLMGCSETDYDDYHTASPPSEKEIDWGTWEKAKEFWTQICLQTKDGQPQTPWGKLLYDVRKPQENDIGKEYTGWVFHEGSGGKVAEKIAALCKAWTIYNSMPDMKDAKSEGDWRRRNYTEAAITPEYEVTDYHDLINDKGEKTGKQAIANYKLASHPIFPGIDFIPDSSEETTSEEGATPEEAEEAKAKAEADKDAKKNKILQTKAKTMADELAELKAQRPNSLILQKRADGYRSWEEDGDTVAKLLKLPVVKHPTDLHYCDFPLKEFEANLLKLTSAGKAVSEVSMVDGKPTFIDYPAVSENGAPKPPKKVPPKPKATTKK